MAIAVFRSPELYAGWPQQVCARGASTMQPASSRSLAAAKPTVGRKMSTRQVTKSPMRIGKTTNSLSQESKLRRQDGERRKGMQGWQASDAGAYTRHLIDQ